LCMFHKILAQINTLAARKAAGFCKDKVTYRKPNKDIRTAIRE
jgi:hypothetical protein